MREIKFRAWTGKEIVYRFAVEAINGFENDFGIVAEITNGEISEYHSDWILMQYTGLEDKNGREIYEGDIVVPDRPLYYDGLLDKDPITIEWMECGSWYPFADDDDKAPYPDPAKSEVIGNAYENPDLIREDT